MEEKVRILLFDIGGVLARIHRTPGSALLAAGWTGDEAVGLKETFDFASLNESYQSGHLSLEDFAEKIRDQFTVDIDRAMVLRLHDAVLIGEYAGSLELVHAVQAQGIATGVLSNTCARHWECLSRYPSVSAITDEYHFLSFQLGCVKPNQEIYEYVEKKLGVAPHEIGFIDDSATNVQAACKRGWRSVTVPFERQGSELVRDALGHLGIVL